MKRIFSIILTIVIFTACDVQDSGKLMNNSNDNGSSEIQDDETSNDDHQEQPDKDSYKPVCGDSKTEGAEVCDGGEKTCAELELGEGTAICKSDCSGWDTANCQKQAECGNSVTEGEEECDGNEKDCTELGDFSEGKAICNAECKWDTTGCIKKITDSACGTNKGNEDRNELKSFTEERVLGSSPDPKWIRLSWQSNPAISMTVTWTTADSDTGTMTKSTVLRVSKNEDMSDFTEISSQNSGSMIGSARTLPYNGAWKTVHTAEICGLDPDTKYYYQAGGIGSDGTEKFSQIYHFPGWISVFFQI